MRNLKFLTVALFVTIFLGGCGGINSEKSNKTFSYEVYKSIFAKVGTDLKIENYELRGIDTGKIITAIDKPLSFNKRKLLTVDGTENSGETQNRIVFENDEKKSVILIDFIFLNNFIGDDLIYLNSLNPYDVKNKDLLDNFNSSMISYNNLIIKVTLIGTKKVSDKDVFLAIRNIETILQTYK